jgi:hypothetical protein
MLNRRPHQSRVAEQRKVDEQARAVVNAHSQREVQREVQRRLA